MVQFNQHEFPGLLLHIIEQPWFLTIDLIGVIAFAVSGLILAYRERAHLFGALVLATMPAIGGGIIRDLITSRTPLGIMTSPHYLYAIFGTVLLGYVFLKLVSPGSGKFSTKTLNWIFEICDALGLAAFTITGVVIAVKMKCTPLWMWGPILAVITTVGGGILRDLCRKDLHIEALQGGLYAEIAIFWGGLLSVFLVTQESRTNSAEIQWAISICLGGGFLTRILAIIYGLKSPIYGREVPPL